MSLRLCYTAEPPLVERRVISVTESWYFELTVLAMVALSMLTLGLRAPAAPPSPMASSSLLILEVFVATHLMLEMSLEFFTEGKALLISKRFKLALFVLFCNWATIAMPASVVAHRESVKLQKAISVGRVFRIVRPVRTLRMIKDVDVVVTVILETASLFATVCCLLVFLLGVFSLLGMSVFSGAMQVRANDRVFSALTLTNNLMDPCPEMYRTAPMVQYECLEASTPDASVLATCSDGQQTMAVRSAFPMSHRHPFLSDTHCAHLACLTGRSVRI